MNRNDMRSVVYLIIALIAFYFLMDDFIGKNKVSKWVNNFVGGFGGIAAPPAKADTKTETSTGGAAATAPATEPSTAAVAAANKTLLASQQATGNLATGTVATTKPKSGSNGWSLNDLLPHWTLPTIPFGLPAVVAGETLALPYQLRKAFGG